MEQVVVGIYQHERVSDSADNLLFGSKLFKEPWIVDPQPRVAKRVIAVLHNQVSSFLRTELPVILFFAKAIESTLGLYVRNNVYVQRQRSLLQSNHVWSLIYTLINFWVKQDFSQNVTERAY